MDLSALVSVAGGAVPADRLRIGVASPDAFPAVRSEIERRSGSGERAGLGFVYRDPDTATEPRRSFPWAEAIVVVACGYLREGDGPDHARSVARFADGDRYDDLRRVLDRIVGALEAAGHRAVPVLDDDRLVDRAVAVRSGIAWWGKSTMALAPGLGPWFLIGSVVTDADLTPTVPMSRSCGTCEACLPACPTGALVAPGVLDARRCLAAILQQRGPIPLEFRRAVGGRLYGCDECLTACPPGVPALEVRSAGPRTDPRHLLTATDAELLAAFGHWYVPGRRARFLRRNALVALGNTGDPSDLGLLAGYLGHPDALLRAHAAWAIGAIGGPGADAVLAEAQVHEVDPTVLLEIRAVGSSGAGMAGS